jgi:hypothetical protein
LSWLILALASLAATAATEDEDSPLLNACIITRDECMGIQHDRPDQYRDGLSAWDYCTKLAIAECDFR